MPGISEVFTMDSLSGNEPSQAEPRQQDHRAGVAVEEHHGRGGQGPSLLGRVKLVVEQGKILGEQFLLSDYEMMVGRYDAGSGRCPDIDLTAQDPAYVHRQHVRISFSPAGESVTVHDMGGRNGSYVNNKLIDPQRRRTDTPRRQAPDWSGCDASAARARGRGRQELLSAAADW